MTRVLVKEKIGDSGVELLREQGFDVELGVDWEDGELERRIGEFDGILIRSATKLTADLIARGRAAQGGRPRRRGRRQRRRRRRHQARHRRGQRAAVERDHRGRAHDGAAAGAGAQRARRRTPRSSAAPGTARSSAASSSYEKTLGILGFGRIGQLVAQRAPGFGMRVIAFDAYVAEERFRELGVERADTSDELYAAGRLHHRSTCRRPPETENWLDAEAFAKMKDGVRVLNVARGRLLVDDDLKDAIDSGKVAGAALDVFREEPVTEHPLFGYPNVVVTPHLGASTAEATDRAGYQAAEQVVAALTGGVVTSAVNVPAVAAEDMEALGPFLAAVPRPRPNRHRAGRGTSVDAVEVEYLGRIAERDTRLLTVQMLRACWPATPRSTSTT